MTGRGSQKTARLERLKEEIMEYIESGDFEYESNFKVKNEK